MTSGSCYRTLLGGGTAPQSPMPLWGEPAARAPSLWLTMRRFTLTPGPSPTCVGSRADRTSVPYPALKSRAMLTKPAARADAPTPRPSPAGGGVMGSAARGFTPLHSDRQLYSIKRSARSSTDAGEGSAELDSEASHSRQRLYSSKCAVRPSTRHTAGQRPALPLPAIRQRPALPLPAIERVLEQRLASSRLNTVTNGPLPSGAGRY